MKTFQLAWLLPVAVGIAAACGGTKPTPQPVDTAPVETAAPVETTAPTTEPPPATTSTPAPTATTAPTAPPAPVGWKEMKFDQRMELMKTKVMPLATTLFQGYDAKKFKDVTCATCHGDGAKAGNFKMPNPKLPKLDPKDNFKKHAKNQKMLDFMMQKVTPEIGNAIGLPMSPDPTQGFGCGSCHIMTP